MVIVTRTITVTSAPVRVTATDVYTPCCKLMAQMVEGGSGRGWIGTSVLTDAGVNAIATLDAANGATVPGASFSIEDQFGVNSLDANQYYVHGATAGDKIVVTYHQA